MVPAIARCPQCGGVRLSWPSRKQFSCDDCGFLLYLNVAAAVAVIIECRGRLLFGVRKHEPARGMLDLPGGFVDPDETAEEALRRELREELQIDVPNPHYLFSFPNRYLYRGIEYDTLDLIFLVRFDTPPAITAGDDLESVLWLSRDAIDFGRIGFPSLQHAVRRYLETS